MPALDMTRSGRGTTHIVELPDDTGLRPSDALAATALSHVWRGRHKEATAILRDTFEQDPGNALVLYLLALTNRRSGYLAEADQLLAAAVELEHSHPVPTAKWGCWMERIQGSDRNWIESARRTGPSLAMMR